jgi:hypothetical protein
VFDGTGSYVTCNIPLSGDITYCFWLKTGVVQNNKRIINITNGATNRNFSLGTVTTAGIVGGYDGTNQPLTSTRVDDNIWHNIVCTMQTNSYKIYIDSISQSLTWGIGTTGNWNNISSTSLDIGGISSGGTFYCSINIAQVQIYNRALSAQEINQNYNATKTRFGLT